MYLPPKLLPFLLMALALLMVSCQPTHSKTEIESAMQRYDRFIKAVAVDSMALMFTHDGNLGNIAHGQDSIRTFLSSFKNVKVLSMASTTTSIELTGDSSTQQGTYKQVAVLSAKDTVHVKGDYTAKWLWTAQNGWRLKSMITKPAN